MRRTTRRREAGLLAPGSTLPRSFPGLMPSGFARARSPVTVARPRRTLTGFPLRRCGIGPLRLRPGRFPGPAASGAKYCFLVWGESNHPSGSGQSTRLGAILGRGNDGVRRLVLGISLALLAAGCGGVSGPPHNTRPPAPVVIRESPTPFSEVTAGPVRAMIPDAWRAVAAEGDGAREGFFASPRPGDWQRADGPVVGMSATWVDASRVGVPSDFYYLAANGPAIGRFADAPECRAVHSRVFVDHRPSWISGAPDSPGDFLARGEGVCTTHGMATRWAFFVAAPGYGPDRQVGIPSSGLYLVVAVLPNSRRAHALLRTLLDGARFGDANLIDFIHAARAA